MSVSTFEKVLFSAIMTVLLLIGGYCIVGADVIAYFVTTFVEGLTYTQRVVFLVLDFFALIGVWQVIGLLQAWENRLFPDIQHQSKRQPSIIYQGRVLKP